MEWKKGCYLILTLSLQMEGGIQGQRFRLDIEGDDISDEALAQYIVEDMRLLMVGRVSILNKKIINEKHKRQD